MFTILPLTDWVCWPLQRTGWRCLMIISWWPFEQRGRSGVYMAFLRRGLEVSVLGEVICPDNVVRGWIWLVDSNTGQWGRGRAIERKRGPSSTRPWFYYCGGHPFPLPSGQLGGVTGWSAENWDLGYSHKHSIFVAQEWGGRGFWLTECVLFCNCENPMKQTEG